MIRLLPKSNDDEILISQTISSPFLGEGRVREINRRGIPTFYEPLKLSYSPKTGGGIRCVLDC
jgi:hypothetical protein